MHIIYYMIDISLYITVYICFYNINANKYLSCIYICAISSVKRLMMKEDAMF